MNVTDLFTHIFNSAATSSALLLIAIALWLLVFRRVEVTKK